jgi:predicted nuclease of predicted toxin-antitoxin system
VRFLIDAQLPPALARWLAVRGHIAEHVADLGQERAPDALLWAYAVSVNAVIVTKDEDFAVRRALAANGPQIIWLRIGNTRRVPLIEWFEAAYSQCLAAVERGEPIVELR